MKSTLLYDEISKNFTALDELYSEVGTAIFRNIFKYKYHNKRALFG